jgi:hypothetical protein
MSKRKEESNVLRCQDCSVLLVKVFDSIAGKKTEYCWKWVCGCVSKDLRLCVG